MSPSEIGSFLDAVRRRLNLDGGWRVCSRVLLGGAAAAVLWALAWRGFGYAAPRAGYAVAALGALLAGWIWLRLSRRGVRDAAHAADAVFDLKDGLISWLDFRAAGRDGEVYQLNERDLAERLASLDVARIPVERPRRLLAAGALLAAAAFVLALLPHSASVRDRIAREEMAASRSAEVNQQIEQAIEEIIESMSEQEREQIKPAALREWVKQLAVSKDARENEKRLARLEQQISKAMQGLEARQDEAVLKLAAEELAKSSVADVRKMGKQLEAKAFEKAAEAMKAMKAGPGRKMTPEELEKLRRNAAKSRDMAKRMADGARRRDFGRMKRGDDPNAKPGDDPKAMEEMLEELDADARDLAKELEDMGDMEEGEKMDMVEAAAGEMDENMDKLALRLGKLDARQKAKGKLDALRRGLGDARRFAQGKSSSLGLAQSASPEAGGLAPGTGTDQTRRKERDEFKDNGNLAEIKGRQTGEGPSSSTTESAESGGGIAGRANVAREREFKQQLESLVHRDDIPESLKLGVREYFETVHETDESATESN